MRIVRDIAALVVIAATGASAQTVIPSLSYASREYGVSGSYISQNDANGKPVSDLTVLGHWGIVTSVGLELEAEGGYGRHHVSAVDSTDHSYSIAGNVLMNFPIFDGFGIFGLVGYGYAHTQTQFPVDAKTVTITNGHRFLQYGGGIKWLLVPNVALRVDYRRQTGVVVKGSNTNAKQTRILLGISVIQ